MEARIALAFVARRAAESSMPASRWAHIMGFELRWMGPGDARRYIDACQAAGLLVSDGDALALTFDAKAVDVPRGFKPDPQRVPEASAETGVAVPPDPPPAASSDVAAEAPNAAQASQDVFTAWLPRVAQARGDDVGAVMAAIEARQAAVPGLHAEAALLRLGAEAGLDVREAAALALRQMQA